MNNVDDQEKNKDSSQAPPVSEFKADNQSSIEEKGNVDPQNGAFIDLIKTPNKVAVHQKHVYGQNQKINTDNFKFKQFSENENSLFVQHPGTQHNHQKQFFSGLRDETKQISPQMLASSPMNFQMIDDPKRQEIMDA